CGWLFFFSSRRRHTRFSRDWSSDVCSSDLPGEQPRPLVFYVPGCDQTKEAWPHPFYNQALQRGMHVFSFDGPGQGESNLRGIRRSEERRVGKEGRSRTSRALTGSN